MPTTRSAPLAEPCQRCRRRGRGLREAARLRQGDPQEEPRLQWLPCRARRAGARGGGCRHRCGLLRRSRHGGRRQELPDSGRCHARPRGALDLEAIALDTVLAQLDGVRDAQARHPRRLPQQPVSRWPGRQARRRAAASPASSPRTARSLSTPRRMERRQTTASGGAQPVHRSPAQAHRRRPVSKSGISSVECATMWRRRRVASSNPTSTATSAARSTISSRRCRRRRIPSASTARPAAERGRAGVGTGQGQRQHCGDRGLSPAIRRGQPLYDQLAADRIEALKASGRSRSSLRLRSVQATSSRHGPEPPAPPVPPAGPSPAGRAQARRLRPRRHRRLWGDKGEAALEKFARYSKLTIATAEPTLAALEAVKAQTGRICPLECGPGTVERNGTCVARCRAPTAVKALRRQGRSPPEARQAAEAGRPEVGHVLGRSRQPRPTRSSPAQTRVQAAKAY